MTKRDAIKQALDLLVEECHIDVTMYRVESAEFNQKGDHKDMPILFLALHSKHTNVRLNFNGEYFDNKLAQYHVKF